MRNVLVLLSLLFLACGSSDAPPGGNTGNDDPPAPTIQGSLTVHTGLKVDSVSGIRSAHVLLGDGSQFKQAIDASGDVRFTDASLVGAQTVTVVRVSQYGSVAVSTFLAIDRPEVWLNAGRSTTSDISPTQQGIIEGRVSGGVASNTAVRAAGNGMSGYAQVAADGTYKLTVYGVEPGVVDLFTRERDSTGRTLRVGIKRGVSTGAGRTLTGQDLVLERAVQHPVNISVSGGAPYGSEVDGSLTYFLGDREQFYALASGASSLTFQGVQLTAPFDVLTAKLSVNAGDRMDLPNGETKISLPLGSTTSVTLLGPVNITEPAVGTSSNMPTFARSNLSIGWTVDPAAHLGGIGVTSAESDGDFGWNVVGPPSSNSFTFFTLPADVAPMTTFPAKSWRLDAYARFNSGFQRYLDYFAQNAQRDPNAEAKESEVRGYMRLE